METLADPAARTFSQVIFSDVLHSYPPSTPVTCCYTLTEAFQPHPRDWVGIFKVGWSSAKDYHTFVWVEPCLDVVGESVSRKTVFKDYYLPKDEVEFYQFCYIDSSGQVRGASTPFCFKSPEGRSLDCSLDCSPDDDLLVITTQEQVEQSVREKADLQKELDGIQEENKGLKSALQKDQQEAAIFKEQREQKEKEKSRLVSELEQIKEQNGNLKSTAQMQVQEMDRLREELLVQSTKQLEIQQQRNLSVSLDEASIEKETHTREKYDRAVAKINQLKREREEMRGRLDAQSEEIIKLNCCLREGQRELLKTKDGVQLLQVDLLSSEKENERLAAELQRLKDATHDTEDVRRENRELCRKLSQQETQQDVPDDQLRVQCQTLVSQLQDAQATLAAEKEESGKARRRAEALHEELMQIGKRLETVVMTCDQEQRKSSKYELQLSEALEAIADKDDVLQDKEHVLRLVKLENEELVRENQNLRRDVEELRRVNSDLLAAPSACSPHVQPDATSPEGNPSSSRGGEQQQQEETPDQADDLYQPTGGLAEPQEEALLCRHCQESFPGITRQELEQHEESHRVCPFCTMLCDNMDQSVFEDHVYGHEL